jgi:S-adenosylmethionine decarboxylase
MQSLGKQLIVELYGCDKTILDDPIRLERILTDAIRSSGATIIHPFFHQFSPHGVSGVVIIAESHVAIHTWPEFSYCALDIFTCGCQVMPDLIFEHLRTSFSATDVSVMEIQRGTLNLPERELRHKPLEFSESL